MPYPANKFNKLQESRRYCYGLQVFSWSGFPIAGMPDTAPSGAVFHIPSAIFTPLPDYAVTHRTARLSFSTPYATCASLRIIAPENHLSFLAISRQTVAERPSQLRLLVATIAGVSERPAKRHMSGLTHPARPYSHCYLIHNAVVSDPQKRRTVWHGRSSP